MLLWTGVDKNYYEVTIAESGCPYIQLLGLNNEHKIIVLHESISQRNDIQNSLRDLLHGQRLWL